MDIGTLLTLLKLATESGALEAKAQPVSIADLPQTPPYEFTPPLTDPTFGLECPSGTEKVWSSGQNKYICKPKGLF